MATRKGTHLCLFCFNPDFVCYEVRWEVEIIKNSKKYLQYWPGSSRIHTERYRKTW